MITSGNHIWDKREIYPFLDSSERVLRPLNYGTHERPGPRLGHVRGARRRPRSRSINLQGRTFMQPIENPFTEPDRLLDEASRAAAADPARRLPLRDHVSEKNALGLYLDGRV